MSFFDIAQSFISSCSDPRTKQLARKSTFDKPKTNKPVSRPFASKPKVIKSSSTIRSGSKLGPQEQAAKAAEKASKVAERLKKAEEKAVKAKARADAIAEKVVKAQERANAIAEKAKAKDHSGHVELQILAIIAKAEKQQKEQAERTAAKAAARIESLTSGSKKSATKKSTASSDSVFSDVYSVIPDDGRTYETDWFA